jgi:hypothetical protein
MNRPGGVEKPSRPASFFIGVPLEHCRQDEGVGEATQAAGRAAPQRNPSLVWNEDGASQTSDNHESMSWGCELLWQIRYGTPEGLAEARRVVMVYMARELHQVGLWRHETLCSNPHGGLHLDSMMLVRIAARESNDAELLGLSDLQFRRLGALCRELCTPDGSFWAPGKRNDQIVDGKTKKLLFMPPIASHVTAWWRLAMKMPQLGGLARASEKDASPRRKTKLRRAKLEDPFWTSMKAAVMLQEKYGDDFGLTLSQASISAGDVLLFCRMQMWRWSGGHAARMISQPNNGVNETCDWVFVDYAKLQGQKGTGVRYGQAFQAPFPLAEIPASATTLTTAAHG